MYEPAAAFTHFDFQGVDHIKGIAHVDIKTVCEGTSNTENTFHHKHVGLPSCSNAGVQPDFLEEEGFPEEGFDRRAEGLQRGMDEAVSIRYGLQYQDRHSPSSEKHVLAFVGSFSGSSGDHVSWTCDQQRISNHAQTLPGEASWNCSLCGKSFSHAKQLKLHERVHMEEKVYRCGRCGRQFPQLCRLKRHERVHTGEKPFRCTKCGKHFAHANNLKVHQSVHTGERRFSCAQCGKSFSFLSNLIRHKAVHTGKEQTL
ncbi:hypothetical protein NFI96_005090 [Prochilodus magdalenae]|nr:hypothetical protein NFI96_005090 [Prochilodus magdalenae]